jgi:hypothetical protein
LIDKKPDKKKKAKICHQTDPISRLKIQNMAERGMSIQDISVKLGNISKSEVDRLLKLISITDSEQDRLENACHDNLSQPSIKKRALVLLEASKPGARIARIAKNFSLTPNGVSKIINRYRKFGIDDVLSTRSEKMKKNILAWQAKAREAGKHIGMPRKIRSKADLKKIRELSDLGWSLRAIASKLRNVSHSTIGNILKEIHSDLPKR